MIGAVMLIGPRKLDPPVLSGEVVTVIRLLHAGNSMVVVLTISSSRMSLHRDCLAWHRSSDLPAEVAGVGSSNCSRRVPSIGLPILVGARKLEIVG